MLFKRTEKLIGRENMEKLQNAHIAVFGVGGVGSYSAEMLARCGVGKITIVDKDNVDVTNINRQIIALCSTVGRKKVDVMKERIMDINPRCHVYTFAEFYLPDNAEDFFADGDYDYVIDALDNVTAKVDLICRCKEKGIPMISCMGTGNKVKPELFEVADIYKTTVCPLARIVRKLLKERRIKKQKVVYSKEIPYKTDLQRIPASISFCSSTAGILLAKEAIMDIIGSIQI